MIDLVGGAYVTAEVAAIAPGGRIVIVGTLAGGMPAVPLLGLMQKRAEMHGTVLRPRSIEDKAAATDAFVAEVVPMLADGRVRPIVDRVCTGRDGYDVRQGDPRRPLGPRRPRAVPKRAGATIGEPAPLRRIHG